MIRKLCTLLTLFPVLLFSTTRGVFGAEFVISGNSNESNEITVASSTTTSVQQTNNAAITNDVTVHASTGNNSANNNTGETSIETGDIDTNIDIVNTGNVSQATVGCCQDDQHTNTAVISNNTNTGDNAITIEPTNTTNITIRHTASVSNTIRGNASTGNNSANNNTGNVSIKTGSVTHYDSIANQGINATNIVVHPSLPEWYVKIVGNSNNGDNHAHLTLDNTVITSIYANANIYNTSVWNLTTGNNTATENEGTVLIVTGNITSATTIKNDGINVNTTNVDCCKDEDPDVETPPTPTPVDPPESPKGGSGERISNAGSSGTGGTGSSLGDVLGAILPATGTDFWLFATIANILMFLLGLYLRLRAGRSPCYAYATR